MKNILYYCCVSIIMLCFCSCSNSNSGVDKAQNVSQEVSKNNNAEYVCLDGYFTENQVLDYSLLYDETYEWTEGVKLPIEKPEDAVVELDQYSIFITNFSQEQMENYIDKCEGYTVEKYEKVGAKEEFSYTRYVMAKDNLVVLFDKYEDKTYVYVTSGIVDEDRENGINDIKKMLGEEFSNYYGLNVEYTTVANAGYEEYLLISPEYYDPEVQKGNIYVITDGKNIVLKEMDVWNQVYPMTIVLKENVQELTIVVNELPGSRSAAEVYPRILQYKIRDGKFAKVDENKLFSSNPIIAKIENENIKYYYMKRSEDFNIKSGRRVLWILDKERNINE